MFPARIAIATATENASPAVGGTCQTFNAKLKLFVPAAIGTSSVSLNEIASQTFEVTHVGSNTISQGDEVIVGQTIDERWIVLPSATGGGTSAHPRIQFVTTAKIANRQVQAKVLRTHHNAPNLVSGGLLQYGDTVTLDDPFNLWSEVESGATGWAYLAYAQSDITSTSGINEEHPVRYEIEECSLPINEVKGKLKACLHPLNSGGEAIIENPDWINAIRSSYNNVDKPPADEWSLATTEGSAPVQYISLPFQNPHGLDGIVKSECVLRRIPLGGKPSDPENYLTPKDGSHTSQQWEVVLVSERHERLIRVQYEGGVWLRENGYHGMPSPSTANSPYVGCSRAISCDFCECLQEGDRGYAVYEGGTSYAYKVISTNSAFYGQGAKKHIVQGMAFDGCDLNYTSFKARVFCAEDPYLMTTSIAAEPVEVLAGGDLAIHSSAPACSSGCTWTVVEEDCNADATYHVVAGPPKSWQEKTGCPTGCEAKVEELPDAENFEVGEEKPVSCKKKVWKKTAGCASFCECEVPAQVTNGDVTNFAVGGVLQTECESSYPAEGGVFLCWSYTVKTIYTLPCQDEDLLNPIPGGKSCIPLTDCPEEDESGGGGTP